MVLRLYLLQINIVHSLICIFFLNLVRSTDEEKGLKLDLDDYLVGLLSLASELVSIIIRET